MSMSNDMTLLVNKIERRLGLLPVTPHLPDNLNKEEWARTIKEDTMVTFSRYFPRKVQFTINSDTCHKIREDRKYIILLKMNILRV